MFNATARALMASMFEGGLATEIAGVYSISISDTYRWKVRYYPADHDRDEPFFTGTVTTYPDEYEGDTLDEVLDLIESWVSEEITIISKIRAEARKGRNA